MKMVGCNNTHNFSPCMTSWIIIIVLNVRCWSIQYCKLYIFHGNNTVFTFRLFYPIYMKLVMFA